MSDDSERRTTVYATTAKDLGSFESDFYGDDTVKKQYARETNRLLQEQQKRLKTEAMPFLMKKKEDTSGVEFRTLKYSYVEVYRILMQTMLLAQREQGSSRQIIDILQGGIFMAIDDIESAKDWVV